MKRYTFRKIIAKTYLNFVLPITGSFIYFFNAVGVSKKDKLVATAQFNSFIEKNKGVDFLEYSKNVYKLVEFEGFDWISDPVNGLLDFSPSCWMFFRNRGDDCDGWAKFQLVSINKLKFGKVKRWAIFNDYDISTAHIILTVKLKNGKYAVCSNYINTIYDSEEECFDAFVKNKLVSSGKYDKLWRVRF